MGAGVQAADAARVRYPYERAVNAGMSDTRRMQMRVEARDRGLPGTRAATRALQDAPGRIAVDQHAMFVPRPDGGATNRLISRAVFGTGAVGAVVAGAVLVSDGITASQTDDPLRSFTNSLVVNAGGIIGSTLGLAVGVGAGGWPGLFTMVAGGVAGADIAARDVAPAIDDFFWGN